ncbi:dihydrofolate reductase [Pedobacter sp. ISL-68]|uniref:dihydrofolate reductase family protein n=1 Tax=unclassified Pedobacter TaxID=2628915 RepID=UPI001BE7A899|nr:MULTISPECIES: dihydrofolate reductase family protein [unclassified Pedobacter]MBT2561204.1 dihydrofolate reductase [Pedobacter sp. ISL-64]MBT2590593.1 dihydrofolate reductase [Pedobacter sp. ISL-68]
MRKISLFIAMSLDGYIAKPNDDLSFLKLVEKEGEDYGYSKFTETIDTLIVGRKTYDYVLKNIGSCHYDNGQRDVYVITRTERPNTGRTIFYTGDLIELAKRLKFENGKNIYCDGGAEVINELLKHNLIDEFIISVVPVLLGNGTRLFKGGRLEQTLKLVATNTFETGLTQLHYLKDNGVSLTAVSSPIKL